MYIVTLKDSVNMDEFVDSFDNSRGNSEDADHSQRRYKNVVNGFSVRLRTNNGQGKGQGQDRRPGLDELLANADVISVEEDAKVNASNWGTDRVNQISLPLDGNSNYGSYGQGVHIYILDTGTQLNHPEFDKFDASSPERRGNSADFVDNPGNGAIDCNGHGTHCGGVAAGLTYGIARQATVHGVKVLNCQGSGSYSGIIAGMDWVASEVNANAWRAVASMSLGGGFSSSVNTAVARLTNAGVVVSVAAGNAGDNACNYSPASAGTAISVGATDINDVRASFSNYGRCVDIFAPGVGILSAYPINGERTISGTSMACPHVTGAAAILLGNDPSLTPAQVVDKLIELSTRNVVSNPSGSPNRLLFVDSAPAAPADPCSPNPCNNAGSCNDDGSGGFTCTCVVGYTGLQCGTNVDDCAVDSCPANQICVDGINTFTCECSPGFTGENCDVAGCLAGWQSNGGNCYKLFTTFETWDSARDSCRAEVAQADLVTIFDSPENDFVATLRTSGTVWIGLRDVGSNRNSRDYIWTDECSLGDTGCPFNNFPSGLSRRKGNRRCVVMTSNRGGPDAWTDVSCGNGWQFICKYSQPGTA